VPTELKEILFGFGTLEVILFGISGNVQLKTALLPH
jgi:hypothetical protein